MKALILGAQGLAGSAFMRVWPGMGIECIPVTRANYDAMRGASADLFVNANGNSSKRLANEDPVGELERSVAPVLRSHEDFSFGRYVLLSSADVYEDTTSVETTREDTPIDPGRLSPYGRAKWLAEAAARRRDRPLLVLRLGGLIGPGLRKNPVYDLLHGDRIFVDPESRFGYLHTDDLAALALQLVTEHPAAELVNVAGRGLVRIRDLMERLSRTDVAVAENAARVTYAITTERLSELANVPESEDAVSRYLAQHDSDGQHMEQAS